MAAGLALAAAPALAQAEWRGSGYITNYSSQCAQAGYSGSDLVLVRYTPPGVGGNPNTLRLTLVYPTGAQTYLREDTQVPTVFRRIFGASIWAGLRNFESSIRFTTHTPPLSALTRSAPVVRITGNIQHFDGLTSCLVTFDANLLRRR